MASAASLKDSDDYSDLTPNPNRAQPVERAPEASSVVQFYEATGALGCFSNFSRHPITIDNKRWPTTEHYFQAQKFAGTYHEEDIRRLERPMEAAQAGRDRSKPMRKDWEDVKDDIMYKALMAKFTQHVDAARTLLRTGDAHLVEHTSNDSYWADGGNGKGKNMLGVLLMRVRKELSERPDCKQVVSEVNAEKQQHGEDDLAEVGGRTHAKAGPKTRRKKLRAKVNVYVDKDGSSKLESANDGKGTVSVVGSGGVNLPKKALPAAAQMAVLRNQFRRKHQANEEDFEEEEEEDPEEEDEAANEYLVSKDHPHPGAANGNKLGAYLPPSEKAPASPAADSIDAVLAALRATTDLVGDMLQHKAAASQFAPLLPEMRLKRDALVEAVASEQRDDTVQAILVAVEAANAALSKVESLKP